MVEVEQHKGVSLAEGIAAVAVALSGVGMAISLAALIFTGPLAAGLPRAIGAFIIGGAIISAYLGWRSRFVPVTAVVQDAPAVVMVAVASGVVVRGSDGAMIEVFVLIALITLITSLLMWLVGRFRLGNLVRYIPNTVVASFIAGTGYLLLKGGLDVMVGFGVDRNSVGDLFTGDVLSLWLPGMAFAVVIWMISRARRLPPSAMSLAIVGAVAAFYLIVVLTSSIDAVEAGGWLIGPFEEDAGVQFVTPAEIGSVAWGDLVGSIPGVVSLIAVAVISVLLNISGLEFVRGQRVDVDYELRETATANLLLVPFAALPGFVALGDSVLVERMGARGRVVPIASAVIMVGFGLFATSLVGFVPRLIVGGLLATIGIALLVDWVQALIRAVGVIERLISVGIVGVIAFVGILEGIAAGVVAACAVFVVRYSRIDPVRRIGSGREMKSRVDRTPSEAATLAERADRTAVYQLQGYLFFGSLTTLEDQVQQRCQQVEPPPDAVVFDFRQVTGIDTSGYVLLAQLVQHVRAVDALFIVSGLDDSIRHSVVASEPQAAAHIEWVETLDEGLERVEQLQLASVDRHGAGAEGVLSAELIAAFDSVSYAAGDVVMAQDTPSDSMIIVQSGNLTAYRVDESGHRHRMRRFGHHAMIGEIGLITGGTRSADIVADSDVDALMITVEQYSDLRRVDTELAFELHELILKVQAERVRSMTLSLADALR